MAFASFSSPASCPQLISFLPIPLHKPTQLASAQSVSGTGALRVGAMFAVWVAGHMANSSPRPSVLQMILHSLYSFSSAFSCTFRFAGDAPLNCTSSPSRSGSFPFLRRTRTFTCPTQHGVTTFQSLGEATQPLTPSDLFTLRAWLREARLRLNTLNRLR